MTVLGFGPSSWLHVASLVVFALALFPYITQELWLFELVSHFRVQMAVSSLALVALEFAAAQPAYAIVAVAAAVLNSVPVLPFVLRRDRRGSEDRICLCLFNVRMRNRRFDRTVAYMGQLKPDIVALVETDSKWIEAMAPLESIYPYRFDLPNPDSYGLAVLSKHPLKRKEPRYLPSGGAPLLFAEVDIEGITCGLLLAHIPPPLNPAARQERDQKLDELASAASALSSVSLLIGDFNITPWARAMGRLKSLADLQDMRTSTGGLQPTWPAQAWPVRIPIDQALARPGIRFLGAATGPRLGSDHLPLLIEFEVKVTY